MEWFSYEVVEGFPVGIGETEFDYSKAVRIFPNPLLTEALVDFESLGAVVSQIRLLTVNGAVIKTFSNNSSARVNLNLREESAGIYILKLTTLDGKKYYKKVIKK